MNGNEYKKFPIVQAHKERIIRTPSVGFCLLLDVKHFFPNWDKMSESEKALWRSKYHNYMQRGRGVV